MSLQGGLVNAVKKFFIPSFIIGLFILSCSPDTTNFIEPQIDLPDEPNSVDIIISDMQESHEGIPHGVPISYDWHSYPVIHHALPPIGFHVITNWGQFYEEEQGNLATNTRVQIRNIKTYYLSISSNTWIQLQADCLQIDGNWFPEDFQGPWIPADIQNEEEGISSTAGNGYCFHFWNRDRAEIDPDDIAGIFVTVEAKLIIADSELPDDRLNARYVLNTGADYWTLIINGTNQGGDIGMGRFKYVRTGWRSYNFITLSEEEILNNPPPLD